MSNVKSVFVSISKRRHDHDHRWGKGHGWGGHHWGGGHRRHDHHGRDCKK